MLIQNVQTIKKVFCYSRDGVHLKCQKICLFYRTVLFVTAFDPPQFLLDRGTLGFEEETDFSGNGRQIEGRKHDIWTSYITELREMTTKCKNFLM
jgi:hypothetical protein